MHPKMEKATSIMNKRQSDYVGPYRKPSPSPVSMHKKSSKTKLLQKIRIIHIFAPEIIKTDVANFREVVQRLTGKPTLEEKTKLKNNRDSQNIGCPAVAELQKLEIQTGFSPKELRERIKCEDDDDIWGSAKSGGGFFGGFTDLDGFMQELGSLPVLSLDINAFADHQSQLL